MTKKIIILGLLLILIIPISSVTALNLKIPDERNICDNTQFDIIDLINEVNKSVITQHIQTIQDFGPHPTGSEALDNVGEYLFNTLSSFGISVRYIPWKNKDLEDENIEAIIPGNGLSNATVITCAHYDSVPVSPGADDDGSGVACVLMMAQIMSKYSFNNTVKFVLFSGEEQGLSGSQEYVKTLIANNENVIGVVNIDSVGYAPTSDDGKHITHSTNDESGWIVDISQEFATKYYDYIGMDIVREPYGVYGDEYAFIKQQIDATRFYKYATNPYQHTSEDKIEYLNMSSLTKVCKLALGTLIRITDVEPTLSEEDIKISIKGSFLSDISQFTVRIDNINIDDTANLSINIKINYLFRKKIVHIIKGYHDIPCDWNFTKEIKDFWEFKISTSRFPRCLFRFTVTVKGFNDDLPIYLKVQTFGLVLRNRFIILLPKL